VGPRDGSGGGGETVLHCFSGLNLIKRGLTEANPYIYPHLSKTPTFLVGRNFVRYKCLGYKEGYISYYRAPPFDVHIYF